MPPRVDKRPKRVKKFKFVTRTDSDASSNDGGGSPRNSRTPPPPDASARKSGPERRSKPLMSARKTVIPQSTPEDSASSSSEREGSNSYSSPYTPSSMPEPQGHPHLSGVGKKEEPPLDFDRMVIALWELKRLPFLPRALRRAAEPYFERALGHPVQLGIPHDQVHERWVCPVCPVFGHFSSCNARDLHVKIWHEEYHSKHKLSVFAAAWKRWIHEHREDFIASPPAGMRAFLQKFAEPVRIAGKDVLKAWLLLQALVNQNFLTEFEFVDIYGEWAKAERERAARLGPAT
ncbi:hypothetical protein AURDEDRAFT_131497 [Auricularia subglabra TFB-10046 SS5]|uniref:Uncharacterized protein n=1 Tax=Auricularia subglabra (strain TFB-10046 / SS5) TaxID=717982 RepID=J0D4X4_AURST|nr:hypothetical protein AURDEDRAFT_131497 [Auricularia subglabra TFB-10046 SS5]